MIHKKPTKDIVFQDEPWSKQEWESIESYDKFYAFLNLRSRKLKHLSSEIDISLQTLRALSAKYFWFWRADQYDSDLRNESVRRMRRDYFKNLPSDADKIAGMKVVFTNPAKHLANYLAKKGEDAYEDVNIVEMFEILNKCIKSYESLIRLQRSLAHIPNEFTDERVGAEEKEKDIDITSQKLVNGLHGLLKDIGSDENIEPGNNGDVDDGG